MTHLLGWLVLGAALALTTWLAAPQRHFAALMAMIPTGASAAVISGLAFWMLWDFPGEVVSPNDWLSTPVLISYLVAATGTLGALSAALGLMRHTT